MTLKLWLSFSLKTGSTFLINLVEDKQEANRTIESYLDFYNNERPHMSLGFMTPTEFLLQYSQRNSKVQNVVS